MATRSVSTSTPATKKKLARGLRYITDDIPGVKRSRRGKHFIYLSPTGRQIRDERTLQRIRSLVIPPAWESVWIAPYENAHLQATGRDARGRKQYRYHAEFRKSQDHTKFGRIGKFAQILPSLRRRIARDMRARGLPKKKVLATIVSLLERTLIRVGNDEYARTNKSYGLTTVKDGHVKKKGQGLRFSFVGKSGVAHDVEVSDPRIAKIVLRCQDLPGQRLFQYLDDAGKVHVVHSQDVNKYIRELSGQEFSAKDFRTWRGTVLAARALVRYPAPESLADGKRKVALVVKDVSDELRNTAATCRKYYIHPDIIDAYLAGDLPALMISCLKKAKRESVRGLTVEERTVMLAIDLLSRTRPKASL